MANCRKCGGGRVIPLSSDPNSEANSQMVLVEYIGAPDQKRRLRSKANPREQYIFGGGVTRFYAYSADVPFLTSMANQFRAIPAPAVSQNIETLTAPVLTSNLIVRESDLPIEALTLDPVVISLLRKHYNGISELKAAGRANWLSIKGVGATRADSIEEAIHALR